MVIWSQSPCASRMWHQSVTGWFQNRTAALKRTNFQCLEQLLARLTGNAKSNGKHKIKCSTYPITGKSALLSTKIFILKQKLSRLEDGNKEDRNKT